MKIPPMVIGFATGQNLSFVIVACLPHCCASTMMPLSAMRRLIRFYKGFFRHVVPTTCLVWSLAGCLDDRHARAPAEVMYRICLRPLTLPPKNEQYSLQTLSCC